MRYGLTSQLRRSASSVPSNIAEGYGRLGRGDYLKHLGYARGSAFEVKTQLLIARRIGLDVDEELIFLSERVMMILNKLIERLQSDYVREDGGAYDN